MDKLWKSRGSSGEKGKSSKVSHYLLTPNCAKLFLRKTRTFKKKDKTKTIKGQVLILIHSLYCYLYIFNYNNKKKKKIKKEKEKALILAPKFYTCAKRKKEL